MEETTTMPDLSENKFQQAEREIKAQEQEQAQAQNNQVQIPPSSEENNELLVGIYLKKKEKTIDSFISQDQLKLIFYNKNVIVGMLESIKLDIQLGEQPKDE